MLITVRMGTASKFKSCLTQVLNLWVLNHRNLILQVKQHHEGTSSHCCILHPSVQTEPQQKDHWTGDGSEIFTSCWSFMEGRKQCPKTRLDIPPSGLKPCLERIMNNVQTTASTLIAHRGGGIVILYLQWPILYLYVNFYFYYNCTFK